jgi:hypothetical protein
VRYFAQPGDINGPNNRNYSGGMLFPNEHSQKRLHASLVYGSFHAQILVVVSPQAKPYIPLPTFTLNLLHCILPEA